VVEQAYTEAKSPVQTLRTLDWTDLYREPNRGEDELQIIHLHGFALYIIKNRTKLVFSMLEYLQATSALHAWHRIFGDEFLQRPFIIIGARLTDEFDLADVIRRGNNSASYVGRPSLIILKEIPDFQKKQFRKWGLIPIETSADSFLNSLKDEVKAREKKDRRSIKK
jgi:hypothetical protein